MKKTLIIAMLASIALMPLAAESGRISVSGSAEISAYPDIAEFTVTATATRDTTGRIIVFWMLLPRRVNMLM